MPARKSLPLKLTGHINWMWGTDHDVLNVPVRRAAFRSGDEIVLDCESDGCQYQVSLKRAGDCRFEGDFEACCGPHRSPVSASCTLYSNPHTYFLFGKWFEDDWEMLWWAELSVVDRFDDEMLS